MTNLLEMKLTGYGEDITITNHNSLYVKTPEALETLLAELREIGYTIKNLREDDWYKKQKMSIEDMKKNSWSLWFAHLDDIRRGKCGSCNGLISVNAILCDGHQCELCGAVTYRHITDDSRVRFSFFKGQDNPYASITMRAKKWDTEAGYLYFFQEVFQGNFLHGEKGEQYLDKNKDKWEFVTDNGQRLIRVKYTKQDNDENRVILVEDVLGHKQNCKIILVWEGKEYDQFFGGFPLPESLNIYEAWYAQ